MTAQVLNIRDYQSAKDRERIAKMAAEILSQIDTAPCEMIPNHGVGMDFVELAAQTSEGCGRGMKFEAPPEDCA